MAEEEKKNPVGRPTDYKPEYCEEIIKFFSIPPYEEIEEEFINAKGVVVKKKKIKVNDIPTFTKFAVSIGLCRDTLQDWSKVHPDFFRAVKKAKQIQEDFWITNSVKGYFNPAFTIFFGKNVFGWKDKQDVDHTSKGEKLNFNVVSYDSVKKGE